MEINNKTRIYIDGANLYSSSRFFDWSFDYEKFYIWLYENFKTDKIYLFLGLVTENQSLYDSLEKIGYKIIFKKTLKSKGLIKGNCDAELVLNATNDIIRKDMDNIALVSSDGDFSCLLEFAKNEGKNIHVISPSKKLSFLIRRMNLKIIYLKDLKELLRKEKAPGRN
ncbi:NYN domain-containing protein [Patescibacteria group bacterium]|nr:NYN domain-containing protein [Patescibacteria group bacterium]MCG2694478.1 NYN domain-containing protein [Candidatus Parcubacteria bacterium]